MVSGQGQPTGTNPDHHPRVLYIMGTGRSGTTILEVLLTQAAGNTGAASSGELTHIWRDGFEANSECGCGARFADCSVWSRVADALGVDAGQAAINRARFQRLESHLNFPRVAAGLVGRGARQDWTQWNARLYRALAQVHRTEWVVDSSKYAARALLLARASPQARVICLTRAPEGLISAFQKRHRDEQRPKSWAAAALYYVYVLACMGVVRARLGERCLSLRYEDLTGDPEASLRRIQDWSGLNLELAIARVERGELLEIGHMVTANRLRRLRRVRFEPAPESGPDPEQGPRPGIGRLASSVARVLGRYRTLLGY